MDLSKMKNLKLKRVLCALLATMMIFTLSSCGNGEDEDVYVPPPPKEESKPKHDGEPIIETLPDPETVETDITFVNQLEKLNTQYLLPMSFNIPNEQPLAAVHKLSIGNEFYILPKEQWIIRCTPGNNLVTLYNDNQISMQLRVAQFKSKYEPENIEAELKLFESSFDNVTDSHTRAIYVGSNLEGYEKIFNIQHDDGYMCIHLGAFTSSDEILVWTINYLADSENQNPVNEDLINTALGNIYCGSKQITIK